MVVKEIAQNISTDILPQVESLINDGRFGICSGALQINQISSGSVSSELKPCGDRFTVVIPYAGCSLLWEVLFNHFHPEQPPDFIFNGRNEEFYPALENIKSLMHWDHKNPEALTQVIQELLEEYKRYQISLVEKNSRLQFEYSSLLDESSDTKLYEGDIEVFVSRPSQHRFGQVNFLMKLPIEFSNIPSYLTKNCTGVDTAVLLVQFQSAESGQCVPQLFLSPRVKQALGESEQLRIPQFPSQGCLMDYVPLVVELLQNKVKHIVNAYEIRKQYISSLKILFGTCLLEYDMDSYKKISFLMEWHDFFFIVTIDVSTQFPAVQPSFIFQSIYHVKADDKPYWKCFENCPHKSSWTGMEMATKARTFILDSISDFQKLSVKEGLLQSQDQS